MSKVVKIPLVESEGAVAYVRADSIAVVSVVNGAVYVQLAGVGPAESLGTPLSLQEVLGLLGWTE